MVDYQTISIVLTGIGMIIALTYYSLQIRNQNKTRNAQLFMNLFQTVITEDFNQRYIEMLGAEWTDYEDYLEKYGPMNNPNAAARRFSTWQVYNGIGFLVMENYIDLEKVVHLFGGSGPCMLWSKWEPIILDQRVRLDSPSYMAGFENLAKSIEERREKLGLSSGKKSFNDLKP